MEKRYRNLPVFIKTPFLADIQILADIIKNEKKRLCYNTCQD
jgi:hypothetical protein